MFDALKAKLKASYVSVRAVLLGEKMVWVKDWDNMMDEIQVKRTRCQRLWRDKDVATEAEILAAKGVMDRRRGIYPGTGD